MVPTVLVFAGLDPGGGAGLAADIAAIAALGAHALPVATALTVQDNNRVHEVRAVDAAFMLRQADALVDTCSIDAVKIGIPGSRENAAAIATLLRQLRAADPALPVVLDPVLASGHGDLLCRGNALEALAELVPLATVLVPNLPEARALGSVPCEHVFVTGGHGEGEIILNRWLRDGVEQRVWRLPRLPHTYHGSGCTLAAAIAARLALGDPMEQALERAQDYCHQTLAHAFWIAPGQRIPRRILHTY
ncbi:bifunctional hydroxymethylpyrimidine kinase/phosphomethylpyrimidine kinase [Telluria aromaticivorans]|uniref:Hydroxymethylpyrimidine/phosphomethylpyrimidine kinase n=1 Tax=Telluria aromaticivorans TaxID=2725995 RepID=A0A7Y2P0V9_9BURK|nr:bifunctional hydroxymethylpyrimidine kinase/phosphomethylpyrimidine kinase [Telluria aromaticivorans]NNG24579.1 hydroxymethylpyrimidine/phosphomethylpyrimidine kinase [Telluria aromaticivorans]